MTGGGDSPSSGWKSPESFSTDNHIVMSEYLLIFSTLLGISMILHYFVSHKWKIKWLPEAGSTLLLGIIAGGVMKIGLLASTQSSSSSSQREAFDVTNLGFSPTVFYFGFLPPIIFCSGYHLKRRLFFHNFASILLMAIVGTVLSVAMISAGIFFMSRSPLFQGSAQGFHLSIMECVAFAALLSSTDPVATLAVYSSLKVEPALFYMVFGESVLNDAITIVIFKVACNFIVESSVPMRYGLVASLNFFVLFLSSCLMGYMFGLLVALCFRYMPLSTEDQNSATALDALLVAKESDIDAAALDIRREAVRSLSLSLLPMGLLLCALVYVPFFLSEMLQLSGVVTILFTGIAARRYVNKNISDPMKVIASFLFQLLSYLAETSCFLLLGVSIFLNDLPTYNAAFIAGTVTMCILSRALIVYPLLMMANAFPVIVSMCKNALAQCSLYSSSKTFSELPTDQITWSMKHMIFLAGLRGAVAYALANLFPDVNGNRQLVCSTTAVVIIVTVFVLGGFTNTALNFFRIKVNVDYGNYMRKLKGQVAPTNEQDGDGGVKVKVKVASGWFGGCVTDFERRYVYPCVLRDDATHESTARGTGSSVTMMSGGSETMTIEVGHRDLESYSQPSSGGGSAVASPKFVSKGSSKPPQKLQTNKGASEMMIVHRYHPIVAEDDNNSGDIRLAVVDASPAPASAPVPAQDYDGKVSPLMLNTISSSGSYNKNHHFKKSAGSRGSSFDSSQQSYNVRKVQSFSPQGDFNSAC